MEVQLLKIEYPIKNVAVVKFSNPPVNAHSQHLLSETSLVFDWLSDKDDVRAVVLTGEGKCFCAGADIKERVGATKQLEIIGRIVVGLERPIIVFWSAKSR